MWQGKINSGFENKVFLGHELNLNFMFNNILDFAQPFKRETGKVRSSYADE